VHFLCYWDWRIRGVLQF